MSDAKQATPEELCQSALAHYEEVSLRCCSWLNSIPKAIRFWYLEKPKLERELATVREQARQAAIAEVVAQHRKRSEKLAEEYGYTEGDTNAFVWRNKEAEWVAITLDDLADDLERLSTLPPSHVVVPVEPKK